MSQKGYRLGEDFFIGSMVRVKQHGIEFKAEVVETQEDNPSIGDGKFVVAVGRDTGCQLRVYGRKLLVDDTKVTEVIEE